jgi:HK97 family phage prohead protease
MSDRFATRAEAAAARKLQVRSPADRPRDRFASRESGAPRGWIPPIRSAPQIEHAAKGGSTAGTVRFEGFSSVTGQFYQMYDMFGPYLEKVHVGSFTETLAQPGLSVPFVLNHDSLRRMALTGNAISPLELTEVTEGDVTGLRSVTPTLQLSGKFADPDVAYIVPKLESGLVDEQSFRFMITAGEWNDDFDEFHIHAVDIHRGDTSIVGYGANPLTAGSGLRAEQKLSQSARIALELARAEDNRYSDLLL